MSGFALSVVCFVLLIFAMLPAAATRVLIVEDEFDGNNLSDLNQFWTPYGKDVVLGAPVGWVSLQENETDTYVRIVSTKFSPTTAIRVRMKHRLHQSGSHPFFPWVGFQLSNGDFPSLRWVRSTWPEDYCFNPIGNNNVVFRSPAGCVFGSVSVSNLIDQEIESEITFDIKAGTVSYDLGVDGSLDLVGEFPARSDINITGIEISGYGWYTGHRHEINRIQIWTRPGDGTFPLDVTTNTVQWQDFLTHYSRFYSNPQYPRLKDAYHTGLDIAETEGSKVYPVASGEIVFIQQNGGLIPGANRCCADHGFGNTVIVRHTLQGSSTTYTQYSHLQSIPDELQQACGPIDENTLRRTCSKPIAVNTDTFIGRVGRTGNGGTPWGAHLHFEHKLHGYLSGPQGHDAAPFGYSKLNPSYLGFLDPSSLLHTISRLPRPMPISVKPGWQLRAGPGASGGLEYQRITSTDGYVSSGLFAIAETASGSESCTAGWYQVRRVPRMQADICSDSKKCFPMDAELEVSVPDAWLCKSAVN
jgi:hypothetical protein